jgi:hypothetical protein
MARGAGAVAKASGMTDQDVIASGAYDIADAMLAVREKGRS